MAVEPIAQQGVPFGRLEHELLAAFLLHVHVQVGHEHTACDRDVHGFGNAVLRQLELVVGMGIAIPGGRFEIIDAQDQIIMEPDTAGELVYYGDNVTMGYAQKGEDLALGDENRGRLRTGDVAKFDADGFYYIVGRMKRFVKVFGKRIGLDELELILKTHYDTTEIACGGKDEEIHVFVADPSIDHKELTAYASSTLEINPRVFKIYAVEAIAKNNAGKTLYMEMEKAVSGE